MPLSRTVKRSVLAPYLIPSAKYEFKEPVLWDDAPAELRERLQPLKQPRCRLLAARITNDSAHESPLLLRFDI